MGTGRCQDEFWKSKFVSFGMYFCYSSIVITLASFLSYYQNMGAYTSSGSAASSLQAVINNRNKQVTLGFKMCGNVNCGSVESKMGTYMACSRCKKAHYCSK
jgi:hypothetical protein